MTILIGSIWRNQHSIARLAKLIIKSEHNNLWKNHDNREKLEEIITIRFNSLYSSLNEIEKAKKEELEENKKEMTQMLKLFKKDIRIPKFENYKDDLGYDLRLLFDKEKQAYMIGCTFDPGKYSTMTQTFYYCRTCSVDFEDDIGCCEFCALLCHAEHKLEVGNSGIPTKTICDCGAGHYKTSKLNNHNPLKLRNIIQEPNFDWSKCCFREMRRDKESKYEFVVDKAKEYMVDTAKERELLANDEMILEGLEGGDESNIEEIKMKWWGDDDSINGIEDEIEDNIEDDIEDDIKHDISQPDIQSDIDIEHELGLEKLLQKYTNKAFLADLIYALKLPPLSPSIPIPQYYIKDYLHKKLHLFEQILMLAHGTPRNSLLPLFTAHHILSEQDLFDASIYSPGIHVNMEFMSIAAIVSLAAADSFNFEQYGTGLHRSLKFDSRKEYSAQDKVRALLLLVSGGPMHLKITKAEREQTDIDIEIEDDQSELLSTAYDQIFHKLFHTLSRKAQILHFLVTITKSDLFKILTENEENLSPELRISQIIILKELFGGYLGFDRNTINWLKTLIRISLGDYSAIDFIGQELNIRSRSVSKLKAYCCKKGHDFEPLLSAISHIIPHKIGDLLSRALQGEDSAFVDLICERFKNELLEEKRIEIKRKIKERITDGEERLEENKFRNAIQSFIEISKGDIYSMKSELHSLQKYLGLNEDVITSAFSLIGLLNDSKQHINDLFKISTLKIDPRLGNAILGLSSIYNIYIYIYI